MHSKHCETRNDRDVIVSGFMIRFILDKVYCICFN